MRAESRFTFKPDEGSANEFSRGNDDDASGEESEDSDAIEGPTARKFFAKEYKVKIMKEFPAAKPSAVIHAVKKRWLELTLKQKTPFEQLAHQESLKNEE